MSKAPRSLSFYCGVILSLAAAVLAFRSAAIELLAPLGAQAPFGFVRSSEAGSNFVLYQRATAELPQRSEYQFLNEATETAARYPLSVNAPFAIGVAHAKLGDAQSATEAMELAVVRNPRNLNVRTWLAEQALRGGNFRQSLRQFDALMRLEPTLAPQISQAMVPFLLAPNMVEAFADAAERRPSWLPSFIDGARRDARLSRQVDALMLAIATREPKAVETRNIVEVINSAQSRSDVEAGHRLLRAFYPLAFAEGGNRVFDPRFMAVEGAAPFIWTLDIESGAVAAGTANGLEISGRVAAGTRLASQSLILAPGLHFLNVRGQISPGDTTVIWALKCETGDQPVATFAADSVIAASLNGNPGLPFVVPTGCGFTSIALMAAGQISGDSPLSIQSISVVRQ